MSLFDPPLPADEDRPTIEEIKAGKELLADWKRKEIPESERTHGGNADAKATCKMGREI